MSQINDINTAMESAVIAQEAGDYATALKHCESAWIRICGLPDSEFDDERLQWSRDGLKHLLDYLQQKANQQAAREQSADGGGAIIRPSNVIYERG